MRIPRFYVAVDLVEHQEIVLPAEACQHMLRVLRLQVGDRIRLFNGDGHDYAAQLTAVSKHTATVKILERVSVNNESPLHVHLGQGISRGERMDYVVQKAVELGVREITPLFTERCEVKLTGDRLEKRIEHWQAVAISACEQSGRAVVPKINPAQKLSTWLAQQHRFGLICDPTSTTKLEQLHCEHQQATLLIGPEGGLSEAEINAAKQANFHAIKMGPRVLRTETAAVVALALVQKQWGDL